MNVISTKDKLTIPRQLLRYSSEFFRSPFPFYFDDARKNAALTAGFSLFLVALMFAVHTALPLKIIISGTTTFCVLFLHVVVAPRVFPGLIDAPNWTVGKYVMYTIWQMAVCAVAIPVVLEVLKIHSDLSLMEKIIGIIPRVIGYGVTPLIISTLLLRNHMLRESLENAIRANAELDKIQKFKSDPEQLKTHLLTIYSETRETIEVRLADLLFVEASDNYSTFHWMGVRGPEKKILRVNLKNVEQQLDNHFMVRCHRSFIVNLNAIVHVTGNANGYKLSMRDCSAHVPVSRAKGKEIITRIEQLRNVIEMN